MSDTNPKTMAERCGLHDLVDFALSGGALPWAARRPHMKNLPDDAWDLSRGTGRTVRGLLRVLSRAEAGESVAFVVNGLTQKHYVENELKCLAAMAGVNVSRVRVVDGRTAGNTAGRGLDVRFEDHSMGGS